MAPDRHQVFAQEPSVLFQPFKSRRHIVFGDQPGADQQVAQSRSGFDGFLPR